MSMSKKGASKLVEECVELVQILAKKIAFPKSDIHPDKKGSMKIRIQEEIADVRAASEFYIEKNKLDEEFINKRVQKKLERFRKNGIKSKQVKNTMKIRDCFSEEDLKAIKLKIKNKPLTLEEKLKILKMSNHPKIIKLISRLNTAIVYKEKVRKTAKGYKGYYNSEMYKLLLTMSGT